jgi:hypothetical protein
LANVREFALASQIMHISLSFNLLSPQVPPSFEGVELVEQKLLKKDSREVFSFFTTLSVVHFLPIFILHVNFVYIFLDLQTFDSQAGVEMDVHKS